MRSSQREIKIEGRKALLRSVNLKLILKMYWKNRCVLQETWYCSSSQRLADDEEQHFANKRPPNPPESSAALPCPGPFERGFQPPLHGTNIHSHRSAIACLQCHSLSGTQNAQLVGDFIHEKNVSSHPLEFAFSWAAISKYVGLLGNVTDVAYTCLWFQEKRVIVRLWNFSAWWAYGNLHKMTPNRILALGGGTSGKIKTSLLLL